MRTSIRSYGSGRPQSAAILTLRMALGQGLHDSIDEDIIIEKRVDLPECRIPELVSVGQEYFHEAALPGTLAAPWRLR